MPIGANDWSVEKYRNKIKTGLISEKKMHSSVLGVTFYSKIIPKIYHMSIKNEEIVYFKLQIDLVISNLLGAFHKLR